MKTIVLVAALLGGCGAPAQGETASATAETPETARARAQAAARPVEPVTAGRWVSPPAAMKWSEAVAGAPDGCRLPERWELVKAFDGGEFTRINSWAWTASELGDSAWLVLHSNMLLLYPESRAAKVNKETPNYVIYLCPEGGVP